MADSTDPENVVTLEYRGKIGIIRLNAPKALNALSQPQYFKMAQFLREIAKNDDVFFTVLAGTGRFFSAGANINARGSGSDLGGDAQNLIRTFVANNLELTHAFYTHPKILITALNGPAVGLSAAIIAFSDFIYAMPHVFLLTPFSSIGLVAEGGASRAFVERLGISKANEALLMSKRITCEELVHTGFVNKVFDTNGDDKKFLEEVLKEVEDRLAGDHLVHTSMLKIKKLVRKPEMDILDKQLIGEVFEGFDVFMKGIPQAEFARLASGEKKHKL